MGMRGEEVLSVAVDINTAPFASFNSSNHGEMFNRNEKKKLEAGILVA